MTPFTDLQAHKARMMMAVCTEFGRPDLTSVLAQQMTPQEARRLFESGEMERRYPRQNTEDRGAQPAQPRLNLAEVLSDAMWMINELRQSLPGEDDKSKPTTAWRYNKHPSQAPGVVSYELFVDKRGGGSVLTFLTEHGEHFHFRLAPADLRGLRIILDNLPGAA